MKKFCLAILTLLYSVVSSGIALEIHYCMGKKAGVDLYGMASDKCGRCGMKEKNNSCCFDEHRFYKLSDSHKNVTNTISFGVPAFSVVNEFLSFTIQLPVCLVLADEYYSSPPGSSGPSLFLKNRVFRL